MGKKKVASVAPVTAPVTAPVAVDPAALTAFAAALRAALAPAAPAAAPAADPAADPAVPANPAPDLPVWALAVVSLGKHASAAKAARDAAKALRQAVTEGIFGDFIPENKDKILSTFFERSISLGLWDRVIHGNSVDYAAKSKKRFAALPAEARGVLYGYRRIRSMFRPAPVKRAGMLTVERVLTVLDKAKTDFFPRVARDKWQVFLSAVEADLTE